MLSWSLVYLLPLSPISCLTMGSIISIHENNDAASLRCRRIRNCRLYNTSPSSVKQQIRLPPFQKTASPGIFISAVFCALLSSALLWHLFSFLDSNSKSVLSALVFLYQYKQTRVVCRKAAHACSFRYFPPCNAIKSSPVSWVLLES